MQQFVLPLTVCENICLSVDLSMVLLLPEEERRDTSKGT